MPIPIAQQIPEAQDLQYVREEWDWLVQPLADTIIGSVSRDPERLYVEARDFDDAYRFHARAFSRAVQFNGDWEDRFRLLTQHADMPHILRGYVGVGKTSLLYRLCAYLRTRKDIAFVYYDHNQGRGKLAGRELKEQDRMHYFVQAELLRAIQQGIRELLPNHDVLNYDPDLIADGHGATDTKAENAMKDACGKLHEEFHRWLFVIIDNLDEYSREVQSDGVSLVNYLSTWSGVVGIVSLRPETLHTTKAHLINPMPIDVVPASLRTILNQRLAYLWSDAGKAIIDEVIAKFKKNELSLRVLWAPDVIDQSPATLKKLHVRVIEALTENMVLEDGLRQLHNHNLREILQVIRRLLLSGFFSELVINQLRAASSEARVKPLGKQFIFTTYLRGPYVRYRGRTGEYRVRDLNIIDIQGVPPTHILVGIRALQLVGKEAKGIRVDSLLEKLTRCRYGELEARSALLLLARSEFIRDVGSQKPWPYSPTEVLTPDDEFILSPAGDFLLKRFLNDLAFRYCEAMADVTARARPDGKPWEKGRAHDAVAFNAYGILELLVNAAEYELTAILSAAGKVKQNRLAALEAFKNEFDTAEVGGREFLTSMADDCVARTKALKNDYRDAKDYSGENKLQAIYDLMVRLRERCVIVYDGAPFL